MASIPNIDAKPKNRTEPADPLRDGSTPTLCVLATVVFFVYACLLSWHSVVGFPTVHFTHRHWPWLGDKPLGEDGFYLLTVSDNLSKIHKLVYNYGHPATGIQPLVAFVFAGVDWCARAFRGGEWAFIRALLIFNSLLFLLFCWQIAMVAKSLSAPRHCRLAFQIAFFLALCDFTLFRLFTYGLETGLYLVGIAALYLLYIKAVRAGRMSWTQTIGFGALAGVVGLTRIDFGVAFAAVLAFLLARKIIDFRRMAVCGLIALAIVSPWFIFVHSVSGRWMPSSGGAESRLIGMHNVDRIVDMAEALLAHSVPWAFVTGTKATTLFGVISLCLVIALFIRSRRSPVRFIHYGDYLKIIFPWLVGFLALVCVYVVFFWSTHFYIRYSSPLVILTIPALASVFTEQKEIVRRPSLVWAPLICIFLAFDIGSLHTGHVGSTQLINAGYIRRYYPDVRVGSFQSGTEGYFDRNVDNLDGKLNLRALMAAKDGRLPEYIDGSGIQVLVDWPGYIRYLPQSYLAREWIACPVPLPTAAHSVCLVRKH